MSSSTSFMLKHSAIPVKHDSADMQIGRKLHSNVKKAEP